MAALPTDDEEIQKIVTMQLADALREDDDEPASASQNASKATKPPLKAARNLDMDLLKPEVEHSDHPMPDLQSTIEFDKTYSLMRRLLRNSKHFEKKKHVSQLPQFPRALAAFGTTPEDIDEKRNSSGVLNKYLTTSSSLAGAPASKKIAKPNKESLDTCKLLGRSNLSELPTSSLKSGSTIMSVPTAISDDCKLILLPKNSPFNASPPKGYIGINPKLSNPRDSTDIAIRLSPVFPSTPSDTNSLNSTCLPVHCQRKQCVLCQQTKAPELDNQSKKDEQKHIDRKVKKQLNEINDVWDFDPTAPVCNKDNSQEIEEELLFAMDDIDI